MNLQRFGIRKANPKDIGAIMLIEAEGFAAEIREDEKTMLERINTFGDGFLVLVEKDDSPVAYISSEIWRYSEKIKSSEFALGHSIVEKHNEIGEELYISSTALLNRLRGQGCGHILLDYLLDTIVLDYPNIKSSILVVAKNWVNAQKIYKKIGFIEMGEIENFFMISESKYEDGIIMRKKYH